MSNKNDSSTSANNEIYDDLLDEIGEIEDGDIFDSLDIDDEIDDESSEGNKEETHVLDEANEVDDNATNESHDELDSSIEPPKEEVDNSELNSLAEQEEAIDREIEELERDLREGSEIHNSNEPNGKSKKGLVESINKTFKGKASYIASTAILGAALIVALNYNSPDLEKNTLPVDITDVAKDVTVGVELPNPVDATKVKDVVQPEDIASVGTDSIQPSLSDSSEIITTTNSESEIGEINDGNDIDNVTVDITHLDQEGEHLNKDPIQELTKSLSRAHGTYLVDKEGRTYIVDQSGAEHSLEVGAELDYYRENVSVLSIMFDNKIALLSNGAFVDSEKAPLDENILRIANERLDLITQNQKIQDDERKRIAEARLAEKQLKDKMDQERRLRIQQDAELKETLARLRALEERVTKDKAATTEVLPKKQPTLLEGWSINGEFKSIRNGFVLKGYLIRDNDGNFHRVLVGDSFSNLGIITGYDDNGRFNIGSRYIL